MLNLRYTCRGSKLAMSSHTRNLLMGTLLVLGVAVPVVLAVEATRQSACDRACLINLTSTYLDAMVARTPSSVKVGPDFHATENGRPVALGDGVWKTARSITSRQLFADESVGQAGVFAVMTDGKGQGSPIALRLTINRQRIQQVETVVWRGGA